MWNKQALVESSVFYVLYLTLISSAYDTFSTALPASLPAIIKSMYLSSSSMVPLVKMGWYIVSTKIQGRERGRETYVY